MDALTVLQWPTGARAQGNLASLSVQKSQAGITAESCRLHVVRLGTKMCRVFNFAFLFCW
jgi:hypothetical protein